MLALPTFLLLVALVLLCGQVFVWLCHIDRGLFVISLVLFLTIFFLCCFILVWCDLKLASF